MLDDLLPLLDSADAHTRQQAIRQIANLRDPSALPHLARIYRTDSDPATRDLALKAGQYLRQVVQPARSAGEDAGGGDTGEAGVLIQRGPITARDRQMARSLLDSATGFAVENDPGRALDYLGRALAIDPELSKETFAVNLITSLTGLSVNQALPVLVHPDRRAALIEQVGGKRKLKRVQTHGKGAETATWDRVLIDFAVYMVLLAVAILALFVIVFASLQDVLNEYGSTSGGVYSSRVYSTSATQIDEIVAASMVGLVVLSAITAVAYTIGLAINGAAIHVVATYIFGGNGTLVYLYRRYVPFNTLVMGITVGLAVLIAILDSPQVMLISIGLGSIGASVVVIYFTVKIISEVYDFGMGSGCGSLLLAAVLLMMLQCGLQWLASGAISTLLELGA